VVDVIEMDEIPLIWGYPTRLMQVFSNLILNAYEAMNGKGKLTIRINGLKNARGNQAVVRFVDTGPGIPSEHLPRIFEAFYSTGKKGSGLGLYICRTILEDMDGTISVECPQNLGTTFTLILPENTPKKTIDP
jgi:signal transduction histidine kinase